MLRLEDVAVPMDGRALRMDLRLQAGARIAVLGPSGAGKSTLLDVIAGFRPVTAGRVAWKDNDLTAAPPEARPVSILFQDGNLFPHLSVARNLGLALRPDGARPDTTGRARIDAALSEVGLAGMGDRRPGTLSGGQQSRAALARVLLQDRPVLLLDEPFSALGPALKVEMLDLVRQVADRLSALTLLVTHDPGDALRFADEVVLVADGQVHAPVPAAQMMADPPAALRAYLGAQDSD